MITGLIAAVFVIAMITSAGNGQWGSVGVGAVIVVLVLALGAAMRKDSRAFNNFVDYWANKGEEKKEDQNVERIRKLAVAQERWREEEKQPKAIRTDGTVVEPGDATSWCMICGCEMREIHRIEYSSGTIYATCKCVKCGREMPVKVK